MIRFTAIDYFHQDKKFLTLDGIELAEEEPVASEHQNYRALMSKLPKRQEQILTLAFYHHLTLNDIAHVTELHIGTVRTHYERGKKSLRELIKRNGL